MKAFPLEQRETPGRSDTERKVQSVMGGWRPTLKHSVVTTDLIMTAGDHSTVPDR